MSIHGWLVIDKPLGISSARVVSRVKRLTKAKKVGHAGTLDPLATGILPLALGEATKTASYAVAKEKDYRFTLTFGEARDTEDAEGEVIATSDIRPSEEQLNLAMQHFTGDIMQRPPAYSAIKVGGKRAYSRARAGEEVVLQERCITIFTLKLLSYDGQSATFETQCSKGTYIRSLARDIALYVGSCGYVSELRRLCVGIFLEKHAISLDKLEEMVHNRAAHEVILPVDWVLDDILGLKIDTDAALRVKQGQSIPVADVSSDSGDMVSVSTEKSLIALGNVTDGIFKPARVFNLN